MMKYRSRVNSVGDSETGSPAFHTSWVSSVEFDVGDRQLRRTGSSTAAAGPPQDDPQPGHYLFEAERLVT